jgi:hypothetical protein
VALLDRFSRQPSGPARARPLTWKVIRIDGPVTKEIGLDVQYGVVISSDAMLEKAQTLLFCPLLSGLDAEGLPLETMPWHVQVEIEEDRSGRVAGLPYNKIFLSTKIVLPISRNEVDGDGRSRGWLKRDSQRAAARKLKDWLPSFRDLAR